MLDFLNAIIPNVMSKPDELLESFGQTIYMVIVSGAISMVFGLFFGIILTATAPKGVLKNKVIFNILDKLVNIFRSIPFVILLTALIPLTRMVVGTAIGTKGAILPLIFGTVPFFTRQIESALAEVDYGLIEAAESMGNSPWEIIFRVYLKESVPGCNADHIYQPGRPYRDGRCGRRRRTRRFRDPLRSFQRADRCHLCNRHHHSDHGKPDPEYRFLCDQKDDSLERWFQIKIA